MKKSELQELKLFQLKRLASLVGISGRSKMSKEQLVASLVGKDIEAARKAKGPRARRLAKPVRPRPQAPKAAPPRRAVPVAKPPAPAKPAPAKQQPAKPGFVFYEPWDLPEQYGLDRIVLFARDPNWLFAYWEFPRERYEAACGQLHVPPEATHAILRVYEVSESDGRADARAKCIATIDLNLMADRWYIRVEQPARLYAVEYLLVTADGRTVSLGRSNVAETPGDGISADTNESWVTGLSASSGRRVVRRTRGPAKTKWLRDEGEAATELARARASSSRPAHRTP
jgi:hypothetical protein